MRSIALIAFLIAVSLPARLAADEVDVAFADLMSGEPQRIYSALNAMRSSGDVRLMIPLWNILIAKQNTVYQPPHRPGVLQPRGGPHPIDLKYDARQLILRSEGTLGALAVENLTAADPVARMEATRLLSRMPGPVPGALAPLKALLNGDDGEIRLAAIPALGLQGPDAVEPLMAHLKKVMAEPDIFESRAATKAILSFRASDRTILPRLLPYLDIPKYELVQVLTTIRVVDSFCRAPGLTEESWKTEVLPALERLKRQGKRPGKLPFELKEILYHADLLITEIPEVLRKNAAAK